MPARDRRHVLDIEHRIVETFPRSPAAHNLFEAMAQRHIRLSCSPSSCHFHSSTARRFSEVPYRRQDTGLLTYWTTLLHADPTDTARAHAGVRGRRKNGAAARRGSRPEFERPWIQPPEHLSARVGMLVVIVSDEMPGPKGDDAKRPNLLGVVCGALAPVTI